MLERLGMARTGVIIWPAPPDPAKFPPIPAPLEEAELAAAPPAPVELDAWAPPLPLAPASPPEPQAAVSAVTQAIPAIQKERFIVQPSKETRPPDFFPLTTPDHR